MNNPDEPEDLTEDAEDITEEVKEAGLSVVPVPCKLYHLEIQDGDVFAGTLSQFEKSFFLFPVGVEESEKIKNIELWAYEQGWTFQVNWLH